MLKNNLKKINFDMSILNNEYISWGLRIILVLYAAMVAPNLNKELSNIFDNVIVRLILACLIVFLSFHDTTLAILLAISFVVSIQTLNKHKVNTITNPTESFYVDGEGEEDSTEENEQETNMNGESMNEPMNGEAMTGEAMNGEAMNGEAMNSEAMNSEAMKGEAMNGETMNYDQENFYNYESETNEDNSFISDSKLKSMGNNLLCDKPTGPITTFNNGYQTQGYDSTAKHYMYN